MGRRHNVPACSGLQAMATRKSQVRKEFVDTFIVRFCFCSPDLKLGMPNDSESSEIRQFRILDSRLV